MTDLKHRIKEILPAPMVGILKESRDAVNRSGEEVSAAVHPWRRASRRNLRTLNDQFLGQKQRCFIIGNGPSLKNTDLSLLKDEYTIGMNRFYMAFPELGFQTTYYLSINDLVVEQCAADIQALEMQKFVSWRGRRWLTPDERLNFLYTTYTGQKFARHLEERFWEGATVTYVALQLAFGLGFEQVVLIGVDHSFATQGKPNTTVVSQGDDPNHFNPNYFGKGFRWQLPDLETSERSYRLARQVYEAAGRQVLDATVGGKLTVFPRVDYPTLF